MNGTIATGGHNEGEGYFDLVRIRGKRRIVPDSPIASIVAPSYFHCHQLNANLPVARIAVVAGRFKWEGAAPIGDHSRANRHVIFKGHWTDATHVDGSTRVIAPGKTCDKTVRWRMKTPPPPGSP